MALCIRHLPPSAVKRCPWVMGYGSRKGFERSGCVVPCQSRRAKRPVIFSPTLTSINVLLK